MSSPILPQGIDNVPFAVRDLEAAVAFYKYCGLTLKFRFDSVGLALFSIGDERPGLLLRPDPKTTGGGRIWVEVANAKAASAALETMEFPTTVIETATGFTTEVADPSGNVIGFADYTKRPDLARPGG